MTTKTCNLCGKGLSPGLVYFCRLCWFTDVPPKDRQLLRRLHDGKHPVAAKVDSIVRHVREKKATPPKAFFHPNHVEAAREALPGVEIVPTERLPE